MVASNTRKKRKLPWKGVLAAAAFSSVVFVVARTSKLVPVAPLQSPAFVELIANDAPLAAKHSAPMKAGNASPDLFPHFKNLSSSSLPVWMQQYIAWHSETRRRLLTLEQWQNNRTLRPKLLILQCTRSEHKCGGTADRLKPLPLLLLGASQNRRLLLIRWRHRPCPLEEFMIPPQQEVQTAALDWRVPDWLDYVLDEPGSSLTLRKIINVKPFIQILQRSKQVDVVTATMQWWDGWEQAYKDALKLDKRDDEFRRVYHDLFRLLFRPTAPIHQQLDRIYATTLLKGPNQYSVAHYRAFWWEQQDPPTMEQQKEVAMNAVHCAMRLASTLPVYFATDSPLAQQLVHNYTLQRPQPLPIVVIPYAKLVHLDRVELHKNNVSREDIYPVFVDLWLLAQANCISVGDGGFGKFGLMLSQNYTCSHRHIFRHNVQHCGEWVGGS